MLLGTYSGILSSKRRTAIPKKFLQELGTKIILAKWYEGCIVIVSQTDWQELLKRLTGEEVLITEPVRDTDRFILGSAYEAVPDNQGRVVIPFSLAEYAQLSSRIVFLGLGQRVEVWDKEKWLEREKYVAEHAGQMIERLARNQK
jgi:MraZ protein